MVLFLNCRFYINVVINVVVFSLEVGKILRPISAGMGVLTQAAVGRYGL